MAEVRKEPVNKILKQNIDYINMNEIIIDTEYKISCSICFEDYSVNDTYNTECNHMFCKGCLDDWFSRGNKCCPLCRTEIDEYNDSDIHYKLVIYEKVVSGNNVNTERMMNIINVQNIRLRIYTFIYFILFSYSVYRYVVNRNYDNIKENYTICLENNTQLNNQLKYLEIYQSEPGTYVNVFTGTARQNCFYPYRYFGCYSQ